MLKEGRNRGSKISKGNVSWRKEEIKTEKEVWGYTMSWVGVSKEDVENQVK